MYSNSRLYYNARRLAMSCLAYFALKYATFRLHNWSHPFFCKSGFIFRGREALTGFDAYSFQRDLVSL